MWLCGWDKFFLWLCEWDECDYLNGLHVAVWVVSSWLCGWDQCRFVDGMSVAL